MGLLTLFMIAVGLSMDAFAVSITNGMVNKNLGVGKTLYIALTFGVFQGIMPAIGYMAGTSFSTVISSADHWIALVLLGIIGGKMIADSLKKDTDETVALFSARLVLLQGIATSIDALAMGVSFAVMGVNIVAASLFIAGVTFTCSIVGVQIGKSCGMLLKNRAQLFGGCVLVLIGIKIFIEHLVG